MDSLSVQIQGFRAKAFESQSRRDELLRAATSEGRTFDASEAAQYDAADREAKQCEEHVERLLAAERSDMAGARPIGAPTIFSPRFGKDESYQAQDFTRLCIARALSSIDPDRRSPADIAQHRWGKGAQGIVSVMRGAVEGGATFSGAWGSEIAQPSTRFHGDFIELLTASTVFDKLPLKIVPPNVVIKGQDAGGSAAWVGEGKSIPVSSQSFTTVTLGFTKVAAISVVTKELLRYSDPSAEALVRDALVKACSTKVDATFLGAAAGSAGVYPAGIRFGLAALGSNGSDDVAVRADLAELSAPFINALHDVTGLVVVMHPAQAKRLSLMTNTLGASCFPGINASGGVLCGDQVVTGGNIGSSVVLMVDPSQIFRIGDTGVEVSVSTDATIEMDDTTPLGDSQSPTASSATPVSMFGSESVALKIVRAVSFAKRRPTAVSFVDDAYYGLTTSTT